MTNRQKGIACAVTGGVFWGGSGVAGQYLLQDASFATEWIVTVRLVFGGLILLPIAIGSKTQKTMRTPCVDPTSFSGV